jgi:hypothetical protein
MDRFLKALGLVFAIVILALLADLATGHRISTGLYGLLGPDCTKADEALAAIPKACEKQCNGIIPADGGMDSVRDSIVTLCVNKCASNSEHEILDRVPECDPLRR